MAREQRTSVTMEAKALRAQQIPRISNKLIYRIIVVRFWTWARDLFPLQTAQNGSGFPGPSQTPPPKQMKSVEHFLPHGQSGESDNSCRTRVEIKNVWSHSFTARKSFTSCIRKRVLICVLFAFILPIQVALRSKAWVCGCLLAGVAGSKMDRRFRFNP